jgi:hypothetical protein
MHGYDGKGFNLTGTLPVMSDNIALTDPNTEDTIPRLMSSDEASEQLIALASSDDTRLWGYDSKSGKLAVEIPEMDRLRGAFDRAATMLRLPQPSTGSWTSILFSRQDIQQNWPDVGDKRKRRGVERGHAYDSVTHAIQQAALEIWSQSTSDKASCILEAAHGQESLPADELECKRLVNRIMQRIRRDGGWPVRNK